jgi:hypothetical protein
MKAFYAVLVFCAACGAQTKSGEQPKATAKDDAFAESALTAYDSILALSRKIYASEIGFQPRQIDAEKSLATAEHKVKTDEDKRQLGILTSWSSLISRHRELFTDGQAEASPQLNRISDAELRCLGEAETIFATEKPTKLSLVRDSDGKWIERGCVEAAKSAIAASH